MHEAIFRDVLGVAILPKLRMTTIFTEFTKATNVNHADGISNRNPQNQIIRWGLKKLE